MTIDLITLVMFGGMILLLLTGLPVVFVLGGSALLFGTIFWGPAAANIVLLKASDLMRADLLVAVPLFVYMAFMLQRSGISEGLYKAMHSWFGGVAGGLAAGSVVGCTLIACMSGISTTGVLMMGLIGYPSMVRRGYDKRMVIGAVMAGGALGPLIPPSIIMIIFALIADQSVGRLFLAGVLPGLLLSLLFIGYVLLRCWMQPNLGPPIPRAERPDLRGKIEATKGVVFPILLVIAVLGSIFAGIATPTEAAAVGAVGSIVSAMLNRRLTLSLLQKTAEDSLRVVAMILWIVLAAEVFASIYTGLGATRFVQNLLTGWDVSPLMVLLTMQVIWFVLGMLMEALSILLITAPIFVPVAHALGFDMVWFGLLFVLNMEMGFLTPPFGINLFVMRGILPKNEVAMLDIYRGAVPFVILQAIGLALVIAFPWIATGLPNLVFN
jgi:tripartite ATP-independent transporter DctM subunit